MAVRNAKFDAIYKAIEEGDYNRALKFLEKRDLEKLQLTKVGCTSYTRCVISILEVPCDYCVAGTKSTGIGSISRA